MDTLIFVPYRMHYVHYVRNSRYSALLCMRGAQTILAIALAAGCSAVADVCSTGWVFEHIKDHEVEANCILRFA